MRLRIQADELPVTVLEAIGATANRGLLLVKEVVYRPEEQFVTFLFQRFPIVGKSIFTGTNHSKNPIPCRVTIRNVSACRIEDSADRDQITILFGIGFRSGEVFFSSAEESHGRTCYALSCTVTAVDLEMRDLIC
jgi:hypothetical protein